jgi:hypothetical protein
MSTMEELMAEVRGEATPMRKQASQNNNERDTTLEILGSLQNRVEEDVTTSRLMKHASVAASVFTKTAADNFKAAVNTDDFAIKVASITAQIIMNKLAIDTQTGVIPDSVADHNPVPEENPQNAQVAHTNPPLPKEVAEAGNVVSNLLAKKVLVSDQGQGATVSNDEVAKQARANGIDEAVLEMMAEQFVDII